MRRLKLSSTLHIFTIFVFSVLILIPVKIEAARLDLLPGISSVKVGEVFKVRIVLSSPSESANAISGNLSFSNDLVTLTSLSKANSAVSLWPVDPTYSNATGKVNFEGVILNGYTGSNATILTLNFKAKAIGNANINFVNGNVLANDGAGTALVTSLGDGQVNIAQASINNTPVKEINTGTIALQIEEIKKKDELDLRSRFLITSSGKKVNIPYKIEVDDTPYVWDDAPDHVFETAPLTRGIHTIKVYMETINGESISKSLVFSNTGIHTPVFTDFSNNVLENEFIVIKGTADPFAFIKINSDFVSSNYDTKHEFVTIKANEKGLFTYVSNERAVLGIYSFTAQSYTEQGIESDKTNPIKISVKAGNVSLLKKITSTLAILIPLFALLLAFILFVIYGWYKIRNYKEILRKRLLKTTMLVDEEFKIIEKDLGRENNIVERIKASERVSEEDLSFVRQFKKDINNAEKVIADDLKDSTK